MLVLKNPDHENRYDVIAVFNMKKESADACYKAANRKFGNDDFEGTIDYLKTLDIGYYMYYGELELSAKYIYISLKFENKKDRVQMIFHRPDSNSTKYIGGLGQSSLFPEGEMQHLVYSIWLCQKFHFHLQVKKLLHNY